MLKNTDCVFRGPEFGSQTPLGGSQEPVTPVSEDLISSSDLPGPEHACGAHKDMHVCAQIKIKKRLKCKKYSYFQF